MQTLIALTTVYIVWGSTYLAIRYAVETLPPFLMASLRFWVAGAFLYIWLRMRGSAKPQRPHWRSAFIIGGFLLVGGNGLVVWGEKTVPSNLTALLVSMAPLWMAIFDWIRPGGRRPSTMTLFGLVLGFVGLVVLIGVHNLTLPGAITPGLLSILGAAVLWAIGSVYSKRAPLPDSPFMATAIEMLAGAALLLITSFLLGEFRGFSVHAVSKVSWMALIYLIFIGALVGFTAYVWLLRNAPLSVASTYAYVNPLVAVFLGWLIAGEQLSGNAVTGGAIILVSVALITMSAGKKQSS